MNELIRKLEKQCWDHRVDGVLIDGHLHFDAKKFAELIVRECIEVMHQQEKIPEGFLYAKGADVHGLAMLNHFGIEETKREKFRRSMEEALKNGIDLSGRDTP